MAQTPLTTLVGYVTPAQVFNFCDLRTLADLVGDTNARVGGTNPDPSVVAANPNLLALILRACGELESAVVIGQRYLPADITALCATTSGAQAMIFGLLADLTLGYAFQRRPDKGKPSPAFELAQKRLDELRNGARIFPTNEAAQAGIAADSGDSVQDVIRRGGAAWRSRRFFGSRTSFTPNRIPH